MVTALATDQARARGFALEALVLQGDLERGVHGLGTGVHEEHVVHAGRRDLLDRIGQFKRLRMAHVEGRGEVQRLQGFGHRAGDFRATMSGIDAPQAGHAIEDLAAVVGPEVHALGARQDAGLRLELAIGRKWHPVGFEVLAVHGRSWVNRPG